VRTARQRTAAAAAAAAGATAAWQEGYDSDVDTASNSSGGSGDDGTDDDSSSSSGSHGSVRYRPVEGGRPTSANRIERLVAMYRQQQSTQQHQRQTSTGRGGEARPVDVPRQAAVDDDRKGEGAGAAESGVSEMLSRFLQD
jgi:hypothetical protein